MRNRQADRYLHQPIQGWLGITLLLSFIIASCTPSLVDPTPVPAKNTPTTIRTGTPTATTSPSPLPSNTPSPTSTTRPACSVQAGTVEELEIDTPYLFAPLQFSIYLPPCYTQDSEKDYPLLVLFHGLYHKDDQWIRIGAVEVANRLIISGEIDPFIMVLPYDPTSYDPAESPFDEIFLQDLLPMIDAKYRVRTGVKFRAVGGLSRGAGWAIHFGFEYPELFGAIGAHSPIIFWEDSKEVVKWLDAIPPEKMPRIYMDIGENDPNNDSIDKLELIFSDRSIPFEMDLNPGYHSEQYWMSQVEKYIRWYAAGW